MMLLFNYAAFLHAARFSPSVVPPSEFLQRRSYMSTGDSGLVERTGEPGAYENRVQDKRGWTADPGVEAHAEPIFEISFEGKPPIEER